MPITALQSSNIGTNLENNRQVWLLRTFEKWFVPDCAVWSKKKTRFAYISLSNFWQTISSINWHHFEIHFAVLSKASKSKARNGDRSISYNDDICVQLRWMLWLLSQLTDAAFSHFECAHILLQYNLMLWNAILSSAVQIAYYRDETEQLGAIHCTGECQSRGRCKVTMHCNIYCSAL